MARAISSVLIALASVALLALALIHIHDDRTYAAYMTASGVWMIAALLSVSRE